MIGGPYLTQGRGQDDHRGGASSGRGRPSELREDRVGVGGSEPQHSGAPGVRTRTGEEAAVANRKY